ncbi:MAG TPA: alpha/beta hydrolase [Bacillales bacterium]|nr:alpha/beta hydrolase [Bacillales bacterium]
MKKLLFVHGAGGSANKWRYVEQYLGDAPSAVIDLPGHGASSSAVPPSIEQYADRLNEAIQEDVIIVGHSMGGLIGMELAARNEQVKGLVLACSHYRLPVNEKFLRLLADGEYPDKFFYAAFGGSAVPGLLKQEKEEHDAVPIETALADFTSCSEYKKGKDIISTLRIPILAVYGAEDRMIPPDSEKKLLDASPKAETVTIDGAGHYAILEAPQVFTETVLQFARSC